jgi:hypothetical protein
LCDLGGDKKNPGHHAHGNGHGHVRVYAQLRHIKRTMHGPDFTKKNLKQEVGFFNLRRR